MGRTIGVERNGRIFYREFGTGNPLVLVPSLWVTSKSYVVLGEELGKYFHVFIPDIYRGNSTFSKVATSLDEYVDTLSIFIENLRLKNYFLVGVSLSGITATKYVLKYKNRPKKVFLLSTTILPLNLKRERRTLFIGYFRLVFHNLFSLEGWRKNWLWITDGLENVVRHFRQAWIEGIIATSLEIEDIKSLPIPTKLIFALHDEFIPSEAVERLSKIKNLQVQVVEGYHGWFFGHEKELVREITHFFSGNSASSL